MLKYVLQKGIKTPFEAAINPQKKKTVTKVVSADWFCFEFISSVIFFSTKIVTAQTRTHAFSFTKGVVLVFFEIY